MNQKRLLVTLAVIILLVGGGIVVYWQLFAGSSAGAVEPDVGEAPPPAVIQADVVSAEGKIVPLQYANVSFLTNGRITDIFVQPGTAVAAGDPLLRLEAAELEITLAQTEAGVAQASANVDAARAQLLLAEADVACAEAGVATAAANLALLKAGPLPEQIAAAESSVAEAAAAIGEASANRTRLLSGPNPSQIQAAEARAAAAADEAHVAREMHENLLHNEMYGDMEERARIASQVAQANLAAAQSALQELQNGPVTAELSAANARVAAAVARRDAAQAQLALLLVGARQEEIAVAEATVQEAMAAVERAAVVVLQAEAAVSQAQAALAQAEAVRAEAQLAIDNLTLRAPFAGEVATVAVKPGDVVSAGAPVATLADFSGWLVQTTDLAELDVGLVVVGMPVDVHVDAMPQVLLHGRVMDVAAVSTMTRGDVTYCVTIRLEEADDLPLRWDMTTMVDIHTQ